jgi:hypothetical protein
MKSRVFLACVVVGLGSGLLRVAPVSARDVVSSGIQNRIFEVWISTGDAPSAYADCMKFTDTQVFLGGCGLAQPIGTFSATGGTWVADVACPGFTMRLRGVSADGARTSTPAPVMAAVGRGVYTIGPGGSTTVSLHGIEVSSCGPF